MNQRIANSEQYLIIIQKLPFQQVKHQVNTTDAQPSNEAGGIMVMVTGALLVCSLESCAELGELADPIHPL